MKKILFLLVILSLILTACKTEKIDQGNRKSDLEFTIIDEDDAPQEIINMIESQKQEPFRFSYANGNDLYIVVGYGEQPTGGYSIQVKDLYVTENAIVIDTDLLGPSKEDLVTMALTYPRVIVKTEYIDKPVYYK